MVTLDLPDLQDIMVQRVTLDLPDLLDLLDLQDLMALRALQDDLDYLVLSFIESFLILTEKNFY